MLGISVKSSEVKEAAGIEENDHLCRQMDLHLNWGFHVVLLYICTHICVSIHTWTQMLRPECMVMLECFLVLKDLDLGIEQAWDEVLVLPLLADQSQLKILVLDFIAYNPKPCELPGFSEMFCILSSSKSSTTISVWNRFLMSLLINIKMWLWIQMG